MVTVSVLVTYVVVEVAYRVWQHQTLPQRLFPIVKGLAASDRGHNYVYDAKTGYRYPARFKADRGHPWFSHWETNSHGHVARSEYPREKPAGEYRIAVVGDSFTANITNNLRWPDELEDVLNDRGDWPPRMRGLHTRVINFGVDGMGMEQFAAVAEHAVPAFQPDLVIVHFISDDLLRRFRYVTPQDPAQDPEEAIRRFIRDSVVDRVEWWRPYPEVIAATIGARWGMQTGIPVDARAFLAMAGDARKYARADAVRISARAVRSIAQRHPHALFLQAPMFHEMENQPPADVVGLVEAVQAEVPDIRLVSMRQAMESLLAGKRLADHPELTGRTLHEIMRLPSEQRPEIYRWFFLPDDVHYTDHANRLYARKVADLLVAREAAR